MKHIFLTKKCVSLVQKFGKKDPPPPQKKKKKKKKKHCHILFEWPLRYFIKLYSLQS